MTDTQGKVITVVLAILFIASWGFIGGWYAHSALHPTQIVVTTTPTQAPAPAPQADEIATLKAKLAECKAEATAWYNASTTQADALAWWFLQGQQENKLDFTISQMYAKEGHDLHCIEPRLLPRE